MNVAQRRTDIALDPTTVRTFANQLRGELIQPKDDGYDDARHVWNGRVDKRPALIARCLDAQDVVSAIAYARSQDLPIAVRGGGHGVGGYGTVDDGLVIDLSPMKTVEVDPIGRVVRAGAGCLVADLDRATQEHALAVPASRISSVGISGLTLGGGMGWLSRTFGLTVDSLLAVEIVTADGAILRASESEHADLFWAVRGGGGNFGVVTSFEYQLHPVGPLILGGILLYPLAAAPKIFRVFRDVMESAPDELAATAVVLTAPPREPFPPALHGQPVVAIAVCYAGDVEDGQRAVQPLRDAGGAALDLIGPMPYLALQSMIDAGAPRGRHYWETSSFVRTLSDEAIDGYVAAIGQPTSPQNQLLLSRLGGAIARVPEAATAFAHRDGAYMLLAAAAWTPDDSRGAEHIAWARGVAAALEPFATGGAYVNDLSDEGEVALGAVYPAATLARLARIKAIYDPGNLFQVNRNIPPAP